MRENFIWNLIEYNIEILEILLIALTKLVTMRIVFNLINTPSKFWNNREDFKLSGSKRELRKEITRRKSVVAGVNGKDNPLVLSYEIPACV